MLWDGNRQAQEYTNTHIFTTVYEQNSFAPVARLMWLKDELLKAANDEIKSAERESWEDAPKLIPSMQIYHYHNDHLGTPNELTSQDGEVVWLADYEAYGNVAKVVWREEKLGQLQVSADELQPIRFQGQNFDTETGLHYNRFRYFDPDLRMFTSRDPIGLMGGSNVFQYAPNPTGWIDPFGLAKSKNKNPNNCDCDNAEDYARVRHYTNRKGSNGIEPDNAIIAQDNNRIYVEPANKKALSQVKAESKYQIGIGRGRDYVEFDVLTDNLEWVNNPRYNIPELTVKGDIKNLINPKFVRRK